MLDEFLDAVSLTQCMGVAFNQSGKENHSIRVYRYCLLAFREIGSRTHIDNDSILDPKGLAFDKLSGKRMEESTIGENGIWRRVAGNGLSLCQHFISFSHTTGNRLLVRRLFGLIFLIDISQGFIDCFGRQVQIFFRVPVANISMMVRGKKDAPANKLSVKIIAFALMGPGFIPLKGYEKHGGDTA
jgi:hypothetical protein